MVNTRTKIRPTIGLQIRMDMTLIRAFSKSESEENTRIRINNPANISICPNTTLYPKILVHFCIVSIL